jgi:drug/metabolite transporter (DMT)-like permease
MIDNLTIALMLCAGGFHAFWHSYVKYAGNPVLVLTGMGLVAAMGAACALPFVTLPSAHVSAVIAVSVFLHALYKSALYRAYSFGDLGQAFPLGRGLVPLLSTALGIILLNQIPSNLQVIGVAVVSFGLIWLAIHSIYGGVDRRLFLAAIFVALAVAGYSVVDSYGTRVAHDWISFSAWLIVADGLSFLLLVRALNGRRIWRDMWSDRRRILASGFLGVASFLVFMWALSRGPTGSVSALRESSVLFVILIGTVAHGERLSIHRILPACFIVAGLIIIASNGS